jgi:hypothetical protein
MTARRRDVLAAAAVAAASLALYAATLQPDFGGPEDTPKFQFVGYVLGVPHASGYPLYILLTHAFSALPIGTIAYRANLFSAVMASIACALAYAIARQLGARPWLSACAALGLATGASFWRNAVFAEVYSLAATMAGLTIALLLAWGERGTPTWLVAAFGAFAIGLGNHLTIAGLVPAFAVYALTRGYRVWSRRVLVPSALLLALGVGQYGLIVARTRQGAPYVESGARTIGELVDVITAKHAATERFAFGPGVLLTDHLPAVSSLTAREFGAVGTALFLVGAILGLRRAGAALVLGAAAGMLAMILNLAGDLKGFITPLMILLWPVAAWGAEVLIRYAGSIRRAGAGATILVLAVAAVPPILNLWTNYAAVDRSGEKTDGRFFRSLFGQLPEAAVLVAEDYWSDMAVQYYRLTGEAGPGRISGVGFDAARVREAVRDGHRVFAFAGGASFLAAEGLSFRRAAIEGPSLADWLAALPRGSVVTAAIAYAPFPADLSAIGHAGARPPGRPRPFEAFAAVVGRPGSVWRAADDDVSLSVDGGSLGAALPAFAGTLVAASGVAGAHIDVAGRTIARVESGVALAVFAPDGAFVRALEWGPDERPSVPWTAAVYELIGESACAALTADRWIDVGSVLAGGSLTAALPAIGSAVIEVAVPGAHDVRVRSAVLQGDGAIRAEIAHDPDGDVIATEMTRTGERRTVFRLALDRPRPLARARLRAGGAASTVNVCAFNAVHPLFERAGAAGVLRPDFESEAYFGAGWSDARATPTGPVRLGEDGASLFLPFEGGRPYRVLLDLADGTDELDVIVDGVRIGSCDPRAGRACELSLPADAVRSGLSTLTLSVAGGAAAGRPGFVFRGARFLPGPAAPR